MDASDIVMTPILQYGFAGFSLLLLAVVVWMIRILLGVLRENTRVIHENTTAIRDVRKLTSEELVLLREVNDRLLSRPCLARG